MNPRSGTTVSRFRERGTTIATPPQPVDDRLTAGIRARTTPIAVWGAGFIGLAAAEAFVAAGFRVLVVDINPERVAAVNAGRVPLPGFEDQVTIDAAALAAGRLRAVHPDDDALDGFPVHVICVNTDHAGRPVRHRLAEVLTAIAARRAPGADLIVSIESTVSPRWLVEEDLALVAGPPDPGLHLMTAPRRDWMLSTDLNVRTLPRVVGVREVASRPLAEALYASISDQVHIAPDWVHAALTKAVENLYRYADLVLTNQLVEAYPDLDMVEVFRLAGTKWNVPTYHPSIGIGGYCIPLSPHFAGDGRLEHGLLPMVASAVEWSAGQADRIADGLVRAGRQPIGILGLSYAANARITEGSPACAVAAALLARGADVRLHDPFFDPVEIQKIAGVPALAYPDDLAAVGTVLVATPHAAYDDLPVRLLELDEPPLVVDNLGTFSARLRSTPVRYVEVGRAVS
jgi:nucleotide sugar dehydrogenase